MYPHVPQAAIVPQDMFHQNEGTNQESGIPETQKTGDLTHEGGKGNP